MRRGGSDQTGPWLKSPVLPVLDGGGPHFGYQCRLVLTTSDISYALHSLVEVARGVVDRPVSFVLHVCMLELVGLVLHGCMLEPVGLVLHGNMLEPVGLVLHEHLLEQVGLVLHALVRGVGAPARRVAGAAVNVARKQAQPSKDRPRARVFVKRLPLMLFPVSPSFPESLSMFEAGGRPGRLHRNSGSRMFGNDPSSCDRILFGFLRGTVL